MQNEHAECQGIRPKNIHFSPIPFLQPRTTQIYADRGSLGWLSGLCSVGPPPTSALAPAVRLSCPAVSALSTHREMYTEGFCAASPDWRWKLPADTDESEWESVEQ